MERKLRNLTPGVTYMKNLRGNGGHTGYTAAGVGSWEYAPGTGKKRLKLAPLNRGDVAIFGWGRYI